MGSQTILIADHQESVRDSLRALLQTRSDWNVCGETATIHEAIQKAKQLRPDVVLLANAFPVTDEVVSIGSVIAVILASCRAKLIILGTSESFMEALGFFAGGAHGLLLKSDIPSCLIPAVQAVLKGQPYLSPGIGDDDAQPWRPRPEDSPWGPSGESGGAPSGGSSGPPPASTLSADELDLLTELALGGSPASIAKQPGRSEDEVIAGRAEIMRKLGLRDSGDIFEYAIRHQLIHCSWEMADSMEWRLKAGPPPKPPPDTARSSSNDAPENPVIRRA